MFFGIFSVFFLSAIILPTSSVRVTTPKTSCALFNCSTEIAIALKGEQLDGPPEHCLPMPPPEEEKSCSPEVAVGHYLKLANETQQRLKKLMRLMTKQVKVGHTSDPGIKSKGSALQKLSGELEGHVRLFDDLSRVGVLVDSVEDARKLATEFDKNLESISPTFSQIRKLDRLGPEIVYPGGWRMLSYNLLDSSNGMIAEFQITLCPLKVMSSVVGHKIYEKIRTLKDRVYKRFDEFSDEKKDDIEDFEMDDLDEISRYAYEKGSQVSCKGFAEDVLGQGEA